MRGALNSRRARWSLPSPSCNRPCTLCNRPLEVTAPLKPRATSCVPRQLAEPRSLCVRSKLKCGAAPPGHCHPPVYDDDASSRSARTSIGAELCTLNINESRVSRLFTPALSMGSTIYASCRATGPRHAWPLTSPVCVPKDLLGVGRARPGEGARVGDPSGTELNCLGLCE